MAGHFSLPRLSRLDKPSPMPRPSPPARTPMLADRHPIICPPGRSLTRTEASSNVDPRGHSRTPRFEPSRVRTFTHVCMHLHPWFEPILSSNGSITWGAKHHRARVNRVVFSGSPGRASGRGSRSSRHDAGCAPPGAPASGGLSTC